MKTWRYCIVIMLCCFVLTLPALAAENGKVAYTFTNQDGINNLYVMNLDSCVATPITPPDTPYFYTNPAWSPDGTKIAFSSDMNGLVDIYVVNSDGTGLERLTWNRAEREGYADPAWSPDGTKIAFTSNRDGNNEIYLMNAVDGTGLKRQTTNASNDNEPAWSPDGTKIAFTSNRDGNWEIYVMNAVDGTGLKRLTTNASGDSEPAWSPDGTKITFSSSRGGWGNEIFIMNAADGSGLSRLTDNEGIRNQGDFDPAWSPGGMKIIYSYGTSNDFWSIKIINRDGSYSGRSCAFPGSFPEGGGSFDPAWGVIPGTITLNLEGSGSYFIGDTIKAFGTNTDSKTTYLYLTGPNLNGVFLDSVDVGLNKYWSYNWKTDGKPFGTLSPGSYTMYAYSNPDGLILPSAMVSFILKTPPVRPSITVTSPNGIQTWQRGTTQTITWDYTGESGSYVKIVLLKAGAEVGTISASTSIGSNGHGSYTWDINPTGKTGSDYKVSIQSLSQPAIMDSSNNYFTIAPAGINPSITVTVPNGGETWIRGSTHMVNWSYTGDPGTLVKIVLLKAGADVGTISASKSIGSNGQGSYTWTINPTGKTGSDYKVFVQSISQPAINDTSNTNFTLTPAGITSSITVTSPNGGETWKRGTTQTITWDYTGSPGSFVKIVLFKAGIDVGTLSASKSIGTSGHGSYTWTISPTGKTGSDYKVSVQSLSQPAINDTSNNNFFLIL